MRNLLIFIVLLLQLPLLAQQTYIYCGKLIDVTNKKVETEMTIVTEGKNITMVEKGYKTAPAGAKTIDLKNKTVLPGLTDMHVHIESYTGRGTYINRFTLNDADVAYVAQKFASVTLDAGFTMVRDLGGTGVNVALRNAIEQGLVKGPRVFTVAKSIAITGGHADPTNGAKRGLFDVPGPENGVADGVDECRKAVRQQVKNGADCIKITATGGVLSLAKDGLRPAFREEEIKAIVETANDFGIHVAAHAHGDEGMKRAVRGGVTTIEHGTFMSDETMDLMVKYGTYYVPTMIAGKSVSDSAKIKGFYPDIVTAKAIGIGPKIQETFVKAYKKGVKIAFGTDAGVFPHGRNAKEFQYMVEGGMPAMEAIRSATVVPAEIMKVTEKCGSITVGKFADIIATNDNPIDKIETLQAVKFVMKEGVVYKQE